ncbi:hypothetical protein [Nocardiopsis nanhaiensis]
MTHSEPAVLPLAGDRDATLAAAGWHRATEWRRTGRLDTARVIRA